MRLLAWILAVAGLALVAGGIIWAAFEYSRENVTWEERAWRGDFWGGQLTAVTSFAGTLLFLAALLFQATELALQKKELRNALEVYKEQKGQLEEQTKIARHRAVVSQIMEAASYRLDIEVQLWDFEAKKNSSHEVDQKFVDSCNLAIYRLECILRSTNPLLYHILGSDALSISEREKFENMIFQ